MERHVLVVLPHPDDESFGTAGAIALYTQAGIPVTYVCGTLGEMGRNMGRPFFANRETLPAA
ncbi:MAG: bacillithiol biosynthesis deacetylase BshB2, partial [Bacilli bacterium]|nr:bacillithiol biosynthesis deacetylase BshB2 [Bacilli bacterium]